MLLISRLLSAVIVTLGVVCLVFLLIHLVPGDPVDVMLGEAALPAEREALRASLGLDRPIGVQLIHYLEGLAHLELGDSLYARRPVTEILAERIPATLLLAASSLLIAIAIALPLGALAAMRKDSIWDRIAMGFSMIGIAIPNFVMGPVLILFFSVWLQWLPVSGREAGIISLVLPALTLGSALAALLARMVRAALLEVLGEDFMRTARAKGLQESAVLLGHALPNAALPVITVIGLQLGTLLGGAVITEFVFSWPGVGQLTIEAIGRRDYPVLQGCVLVISLSYVAINTLTDLIYAGLDPRIRLGDAES